MKNVILLETHEEIMNAYMHADLPELGLYVLSDDVNESKTFPGISTNIRPAIGYFDKRYGVYAGWCQGKDIWVGLNDAPEEMVWKDAKKYCEELDADCEGWHLPTKEELMLIYINKGIINEALIKSGGEPLKDSWYWSSTEINSGNSWKLSMNNGFNDYNKYRSNNVRPVLAF